MDLSGLINNQQTTGGTGPYQSPVDVTGGGTSCPTITTSSPTPIRASWLCIRCSKINAPHRDQCDCAAVAVNPNYFIIPYTYPQTPVGLPWDPPFTVTSTDAITTCAGGEMRNRYAASSLPNTN